MPRKQPSLKNDPRRPTAEELHELYKKNGKFRRFHGKKAKREEEKDSGPKGFREVGDPIESPMETTRPAWGEEK